MSSSDIAIRIEGLGKRYKLGETLDTARNFRETLMTLPRHLSRKALGAVRRASTGTKHEATTDERQGAHADPSHVIDPREENGWFWALKDINLEIKRGEAVGIIGRNGAGKSTLLKVLSRITEPTEGHAEIHGRVGALLEVGTGMHQELTGRENIYLNGAILGMRREEINRKFDEIVEFAGTEKFLDTPLKRYSSGMRVRLGFSVAAHLEPEILVVDEVLAVGDAEFRKKCLGKMDDVTQGGRTVLFVSHNMGAIQNLCPSACLLDQGIITFHGSSSLAVGKHLEQSEKQSRLSAGDRKDRSGSGAIRLLNIRAQNAHGVITNALITGEAVNVILDYEVFRPIHDGNFTFHIQDMHGSLIASCNMAIRHGHYRTLEKGQGTISCQIERLPLLSGDYFLNVILASPTQGVYDSLEQALSISVTGGDFFNSGLAYNMRNAMAVEHKWYNSSLP